ncbi:hypothetical protein PAXRUDRAFT_22614 [Paxillus rubicundulus Ve08.2h10]|uniref:Uncharacterized protein n=1 Tax=Paxillus rubicundulus Ve08.2h10 TaxID=930991 RepID=A0A0D0D552_9AGAM|nr:hypothetical protein PAXRUDRAFT_22614 [Paxillus rubicundulus Ve08.2h10]
MPYAVKGIGAYQCNFLTVQLMLTNQCRVYTSMKYLNRVGMPYECKDHPSRVPCDNCDPFGMIHKSACAASKITTGPIQKLWAPLATEATAPPPSTPGHGAKVRHAAILPDGGPSGKITSSKPTGYNGPSYGSGSFGGDKVAPAGRRVVAAPATTSALHADGGSVNPSAESTLSQESKDFYGRDNRALAPFSGRVLDAIEATAAGPSASRVGAGLMPYQLSMPDLSEASAADMMPIRAPSLSQPAPARSLAGRHQKAGQVHDQSMRLLSDTVGHHGQARTESLPKRLRRLQKRDYTPGRLCRVPQVLQVPAVLVLLHLRPPSGSGV